MANTVEGLGELLQRFIAGDKSPPLAGAIEAALEELFPDDERFEDLVLALASYQPGGGEFLFDYARLRPLCVSALARLEAEGPASQVRETDQGPRRGG